ncbi:MAG: DJ-1/PfpI family protein, partial [Pseudomonadota bacterium]
ADYTALIIPGGQRSIDKLAANPHARRILTGFLDAEKPVIAFGHAPSLFASFERAAGTKVSADAAVAETLTSAGATVSEELTTISGSVMTSTIVEEEPLRELLDQAIELIAGTGQVADAA